MQRKIVLIPSGSELRSLALGLNLFSKEAGGMIDQLSDRIGYDKQIRNVMTVDLSDFHAVIDRISDGITVSDAKGRFEIFNSRMHDITGYSIQDANNGVDFNVLIYPDQKERQEAVKRLSGIRANNGCIETEAVIQAKGGIKKIVLIATSLIRYKNQDMFLSVWRDVTQRRQFERDRESAYEKVKSLNDALKRVALQDSHTGLYNHRFFTEYIKMEFSRARRQSLPLSLLMIDIDYFKSINDVYGHQFGDIILKQFADLLKNTVRLYDVAVRYGGEEFMVIAPGTDEKSASALANRFLSAVSLHNFGNSEHSVKLKISIAVISYPGNITINGEHDLIKVVDQILSKVKEDGGNRVYASADLEDVIALSRSGTEPSIVSLKNKIRKLTARGNQSVIEAILAFAKTIEVKDFFTGQHVENTIRYAVMIAERLNLSRREIEIIKEASALHDLGKVGVSEKLLLKSAKLTKGEFEEIKKHPQIGADIIRPIYSLRDIIPAIMHHHERWDGRGYPNGLKKEAIPVGARVVAIADVYQALVSDRPYRKAYDKPNAIKILKKGSGTQFDPKIVDLFLGILQHEN